MALGSSNTIVEDSIIEVGSNLVNATNFGIDLSGIQNLITRSRITVEGGPGSPDAWGLNQVDVQGSVISGNAIWMRSVGSNVAAVFIQNSQHPITYVNNTFMGSYSTAGVVSVAFQADSQSTGVVTVLNNAFDGFALISNYLAPQNLLVQSNRFNGAQHLTCNQYLGCSDDPNNGLSFKSGSFDNAIADCKLANLFAGDWHLTTGSPCIDTASPDPSTPSRDLDGDSRPLGNLLDIGADEF
ncbi:MAG: hypothetical protein E6J88_01750, partial [Deltaproteobacteria bacterium]